MQSLPFETTKLNRLEVVLKTVERCNINCTYCYFFNDKDKSYLKHPKYISIEMLEKISEFLLKGVKDLKIENLTLIIHGGEPLLQKKKDFDIMCKIFSDKLNNHTHLSFSVQTNGLLVNQNWIELFEKYNFSVGVSIDGPKSYNDKYRIDHKGRGTYDRLKNGLDQLFMASNNNKIKKPASLSVINPDFSASIIYRHLVKDLGFTVLDFLLPDLTHETASKTVPNQIKKYLSELFQSWKTDDNPSINIRILDSVLNKLLSSAIPFKHVKLQNQIISISTGGHIVPNDILRNTQLWDSQKEPSILSNSLIEILNSPLFNFLRKAETTIPRSCLACCWSEICKGGELINRYKVENKFDNPSIYCNALKELYCDITKHLLSTGISYKMISDSLNLKV